jgi:hypothetical protein
MPDTFARTEADGARLIWLVDLTYAGEVLRLSTEAAQIASDDGALQYVAALTSVQWADTMAGFSSEGSAPSVSLTIVMPPDYSWAARVAAGHVLGFATAALSMIREGDAYEARVRVLSGRLDAPVYEGAGEPMRCSITAAPFDDVGAMVPGSAVITEASLPASHTDHQGNAYPIVIGHPRRSDATAPASSPAWIANTTNEWLIIAGHRVGATQVNIEQDPPGSSDVATVAHTQDNHGRTFAYVDITGLGSISYNDESSYWVQWLGDGNHAMYNRRRTGPLEGAGDVLEWALSKSTLDIDRGRMAAAADKLNAFKLAGYTDDLAATPWDWVRTRILPILPVEIRRGPDGLYPVVHQYDATAADSLEDIDTQRDGLHRTTGVEYRPSRHGEVANEIRVMYALSGPTNEYTRTCVVHGDPQIGTGADLYLSHTCRRSRIQSPTAQPMVHTVNADLVYDSATAAKIGHWLAAAKSIPSRMVTYQAPMRLAYLHPGDVVTLTDSDLALTAQLCLVRSVSLQDAPTITIQVETLDV